MFINGCDFRIEDTQLGITLDFKKGELFKSSINKHMKVAKSAITKMLFKNDTFVIRTKHGILGLKQTNLIAPYCWKNRYVQIWGGYNVS